MSLLAFDASGMDSDGDHMPDWQELVAGTDSTNGSSFLGLQCPPMPVNGTGFTVQWQGATGRLYIVARCTDLLEDSPFTVLSSNIAGQAGTMNYTDTNAPALGSGIYRIGIKQ